MSFFDALRHDVALALRLVSAILLREEAPAPKPEDDGKPKLELTLADWPPTLVYELLAFAFEEDIDLEVALAVLAGRALHAKALSDLEFEEELRDLLDEGVDE
jgi:hypothetical protein